MFHFPPQNFLPLRNSGRGAHCSVPLLPVVALPFLLGIAAGTVIGLFSETQDGLLSSSGFFSLNLSVSSFPYLIWYVFRYHLIAAVLATGILGIVLLPLLSALRAFVLACSIAAIIQSGGTAAIAAAFVSLGVPALLGLPGFLIAATDAFFVSRKLLLRDQRAILSEIPLIRHLLWIILLGSAELLYLRFLLPPLLGMFP